MHISHKWKNNYLNGIPEIGASEPVINSRRYKWKLLPRHLISSHSSAPGPQQNRVQLTKYPRNSFIVFPHLYKNSRALVFHQEHFCSIHFLMFNSWMIFSFMFYISLTFFFKTKINSGELHRIYTRLYAHSF